jgi:hypothetical protein
MNNSIEKTAEELVNTFISLSNYPDHCAIVVIDKLIEYAKTFGDTTESDIKKFEEIKQEIIDSEPQWKYKIKENE